MSWLDSLEYRDRRQMAQPAVATLQIDTYPNGSLAIREDRPKIGKTSLMAHRGV